MIMVMSTKNANQSSAFQYATCGWTACMGDPAFAASVNAGLTLEAIRPVDRPTNQVKKEIGIMKKTEDSTS